MSIQEKHDPLSAQDHLIAEQSANNQSDIGQMALSGLEVSAEHFYSADSHLIGKTFDGEHRILVGTSSEDGATRNEAVGTGSDVESALRDSLEKMRTLETIQTRSLARIEMTESTFVSFTTLEHYSPKVAPSRDTYPIPSYLEATLTDNENGDNTYQNTVSKESWHTELSTLLADYLADDPAGQQLASGLRIRSLSHLTPEQAVKLSAAFVQNVSRYTKTDVGSKGPTHADQSTTPELLKEGITNKEDSNWEGNGVCRNVASNIKAVFEALRETQAELSMLNNTYCVYGAGADGAGYADSRANPYTMSLGDKTGHAWNTFVTIDSKGSAVATIIDATWALDKDVSSAIEHLDRTEVRAAAQLVQLFEKSEVKTEAFFWLTDYVQRLMRSSYMNRQIRESIGNDIRDYVTTEYLRVARLLPEIPDGISLPDAVAANAYRLRGKLEREEVEMLFALDKAGGSIERDRIKAIIAGYDGKREVSIPGWRSAENLVFDNEDLQELTYQAISEERVSHLAEESGKFRARLRELHPEELPPFNANELRADFMELSYFAQQSGIHDKNPKIIMRQFHNRLKRLAGNDNVYNAVITGRSDYDLAKNFNSITKALRS